ncbi:hypothetical protein ACH5RR_018487 [Cinchona calisaya]|uniref:Uncharacterized protein n=1 Tax=Cinchona calisaya TaxID=153742 RepID=A0ABD2ZRR0_9GENT
MFCNQKRHLQSEGTYGLAHHDKTLIPTLIADDDTWPVMEKTMPILNPNASNVSNLSDLNLHDSTPMVEHACEGGMSVMQNPRLGKEILANTFPRKFSFHIRDDYHPKLCTCKVHQIDEDDISNSLFLIWLGLITCLELVISSVPYIESSCNFSKVSRLSLRLMLLMLLRVWVPLDEQGHAKDSHDDWVHSVKVTFVYTKCTQVEQQVLWADLISIAAGFSSPWVIGGDFNVIELVSEYLG